MASTSTDVRLVIFLSLLSLLLVLLSLSPLAPAQSVVDWDEITQTGRVEKMGDLKIRLDPLGQAQAWYGEQHGFIWECYAHKSWKREATWEEDLMAFWQAVEGDLGSGQIYTEPHEPAFEGDYLEFLRRPGYAPDQSYPRWGSKVTHETRRR
jgi:hypothetical protein